VHKGHEITSDIKNSQSRIPVNKLLVAGEGTGLTGDDTAVLSTLLPPAHPDDTIPLPSSLRIPRSVPSFHRLDLPSDLRLPSHTSRNFTSTSPIALTFVLTHILTTTPTQST